MNQKVVSSITEALHRTEIKDGMTLSFHHHLRNGDYVLNLVMAAVRELGLKDMTINASAIFDCHLPLVDLIRDNTVTALECNYMGALVGRSISAGILEKPVIFRTHGGRPADLERGKAHIDIAFIAAPTTDTQGNISGKYGPSACGSLGYAFSDARYADKVVAVTDNLAPYPLTDFSIPETEVDYVVPVEQIGDPAGIVSGTTRITRDPIGLLMADMAAEAISASGLLQDGFSFQTGAGGASLAAAFALEKIMLREGIRGSFASGGITSQLVDMQKKGCFETLLDVQCFDLGAVESIRDNPQHREISASRYASPCTDDAVVDSLDVVILGATEVDTSFNVNVHTNSQGLIMGGSGGHSDTAAGAKLAIIIAPLMRARIPLIVDHMHTISTPGETVDMLVTQYGIAVNPNQVELADRLRQNRLKVISVEELQEIAENICGKPKALKNEGRIVAEVHYRDGSIIDTIRQACS
ncbi:MAG TPA: citrate lyase subunit alpha [Clostridiaceae bacterium]|nr:citrate lyase subunit alpha [Clostridiaceae bacterium]